MQARAVEFALKKKTAGWWKSLTKDGAKSRFVKTDWNKWQDEGDDDYEKDLDTGGMDFASMMGGAGAGGGADIASMVRCARARAPAQLPNAHVLFS